MPALSGVEGLGPKPAACSEHDDHPARRAAEAWIDDVLVLRAEGVADPEADEVAVRREELALPDEDLLVSRLAARQIDLIVDPADVAGFLRRVATDFPTLRVQGLMTLAVNSPDPAEVRACFRALRELRDRLRQENLPGVSLDRLSMGMSGDFELAIEEGSTEVRIGSAIFGARHYPDPQ